MPIELRGVGYTYAARTPFSTVALRDLSFTVADGDYLGVIGRTGSGKSTLVQLLNGLLSPACGSVVVDGVHIGPLRVGALRALRSKVGLVFQSPETQLFEETVGRDIAFGPTNLGLQPTDVAYAVRASLSAVGLDPDRFADRSPFELSGGEKRRVAIAGVVAMNPRYLVMDEPTAGLDPLTARAILDMLDSLHRNGITVILVTHVMEDVAERCSRVIALRDGAIVADCSPRELFASPELSREVGMGVPQTVAIHRALAGRGLNLRDVPMTVDECAQGIGEVLRGGQG